MFLLFSRPEISQIKSYSIEYTSYSRNGNPVISVHSCTLTSLYRLHPCTGYTPVHCTPFPSYVPLPLHKHPDPFPPFHDCEFHRFVDFESHSFSVSSPGISLCRFSFWKPISQLVISPRNSTPRRFPSYLLVTLLLYFLANLTSVTSTPN